MLVYKVTFLSNKIISCAVTDPARYRDMKEDVFVSRNNGLLIFALIKANSKAMALDRAARIIKEVESGKEINYPEYIDDLNDILLTDPMNLTPRPISTPDFIDPSDTDTSANN